MEDVLSRFVENLTGRVSGVMSFRFYFQPLMAVIFAVLDGIRDARQGATPFLWTVITRPEHRRELLRSAWKSIGKIFIIAFILDLIYQIRVLHWFYPGESLVVAMLLAVVPYALFRGPVQRVFLRWHPQDKARAASGAK